MKRAGEMEDRDKVRELVDIVIDQKMQIDVIERVRDLMYHEIDNYKKQIAELEAEIARLNGEEV